MQHFSVYLVQLVDLCTMLIYCEVCTKLNYKSRALCLLPPATPAVMYHWSHLVWEKKAYVFLSSSMEKHQRNNLITSLLIPNSKKSDKYHEPAFTVTCFSASSSPIPAHYCTLWKGRYASFLEREGCFLPTTKCNSAMYIWMRPQGTSQYIKKRFDILSS